MYKKILVPMALDHDISPNTLEIAQTLLDDGGKIVALHVYDAPKPMVSAYLDEETVKAAYATAEARLVEKLSHVEGIEAKIVDGHASRTIIEFANNNGVECIVIGSHRPGLSDYFLGSTASRVVRYARCAVHVYRRED